MELASINNLTDFSGIARLYSMIEMLAIWPSSHIAVFKKLPKK
jgi:hypothetical protein